MEVNSKPRIKLSEDVEKVTIPGKKSAYRLYGSDGRYQISAQVKCTFSSLYEPHCEKTGLRGF